MNLEYKILWFENESDWFDSIIDDVKEIIEDIFGFKFVSPTREIDDSNFENLRFEDYDLVLMDYNLENAPNGDTIIQRLRDNEIYTDVVFYSSRGEHFVREKMKENGIDGVYCVSRDSAPFIQKVQKIIQTTIKKVQDLNNMRGLIMAETSDIDKSMFEIISNTLHKNSFELRDKLKETIVSNVEKKIESKSKYFNKCQSNDEIAKIIKDPLMFDACEKLKALQFIFEEADHEVANRHKSNSFADNYGKIITKRNLLGHETPREIDGKKIIGKGINEFEFNDDFCVDIRNNIRIYADDLKSFLRDISVE